MGHSNELSTTLPGQRADQNFDREEVISSVEIIHPKTHPPPPPQMRRNFEARKNRPLRLIKTPQLARDLMTRQVLTIGPQDSLLSMEEAMQALRFRHLPVVEGDTLVGLISSSDLMELSSSKLSKTAAEENPLLHQLPASRIMRRDVVTVRPDEALVNVAALMWETRVRCLPVTEPNGTLVGIITEGDFVRVAHHYLMTIGMAH